MFHAATAPNIFCTPLRNGEKCFVLPRFDLETWFWAHEEYRITDLGAVPPIVVMAINSPLKDKYSFKSVKAGMIGAAPLDKGPQARMQALLAKEAPFTQVW
jgi:acyl-CoA synthetase (AMP-forming)/AMP-acid ligase II